MDSKIHGFFHLRSISAFAELVGHSTLAQDARAQPAWRAIEGRCSFLIGAVVGTKRIRNWT